MRQAAQRNIHYQNCLPADPDTVGIRDLGVATHKAVADAFAAWEKRRGIVRPAFRFDRRIDNPMQKPKAVKEPPLPRQKLTEAERIARKQAAQKAWKEANREKIKAANAAYKRNRKMTPEQLEKQRARSRAWKDRNRETVRAAGRAYAARKREEAKA